MYEEYKNRIILNNKHFQKTVQDNCLVVSWKAIEEKEIEVPVIKYQHTKVTMNGSILGGQERLSIIGNPIVKQKPGRNTLKLVYEEPSWLKYVVQITLCLWAGVIVFVIVKFGRKLRECSLD